MNGVNVSEDDRDDAEKAMERVRQQATLLIAKINPAVLNALHDVIRGEPAMVGAACLAAALADVLAFVSKTGVETNVLIVSEMVLRLARSAMQEKQERENAESARLRLHH